MSRTKPNVAFDATSDALLSDPETAAMYLEEMLAEGDVEQFKRALRDVASARVGGMAELARETDLAREALYRSLSRRGNPRLDTLTRVLRAAGLRLSIAPESAA